MGRLMLRRYGIDEHLPCYAPGICSHALPSKGILSNKHLKLIIREAKPKQPPNSRSIAELIYFKRLHYLFAQAFPYQKELQGSCITVAELEQQHTSQHFQIVTLPGFK